MQLFVDKIRRYFQVDTKIDRRFDFRQHLACLELLNGSFQHLTVQVEADGFDVTVLLSAKQVPSAAQLQVESGDSEPRAQFAEFVDSRKPPARDLGQCFIRRYQ